MKAEIDLQHVLFSKAVITDGCWVWRGYKDGGGYGRFGPRRIRSHRAAYEAFRGPIRDGLHVLHRCDNPACINPDHLFLGTHADNMRDKTQKGRAHGAQPGERHAMARLTVEKVQAIRADPRIHRLIALDFGVSRRHVGEIKARRFWAHV